MRIESRGEHVHGKEAAVATVAARMRAIGDVALLVGLGALGGSLGWYTMAACTPPLDVAASVEQSRRAAHTLDRAFGARRPASWDTWFGYTPEGQAYASTLKRVNLRGTVLPEVRDIV